MTVKFGPRYLLVDNILTICHFINQVFPLRKMFALVSGDKIREKRLRSRQFITMLNVLFRPFYEVGLCNLLSI